MSGRFRDKVAIVTGGAGGIGSATARLLAREGARVLISDLIADGEEVAAGMRGEGLQVVFMRADTSAQEQVAGMVEAAVQRWGRLDVMVANAGISGRGSAIDASTEDWRHVLDVNLTGVFLCTKYAVPAMRASGGGAIVNTASIMGVVGHRGAAPYTATKGAVINLTRSTALDHAAEGIRINAVCPGHLDQPTRFGGAQARSMFLDDLVSRYPMGRLGRPEEVAEAIAFLASDQASFITGTALIVDGGYTAQ